MNSFSNQILFQFSFFFALTFSVGVVCPSLLHAKIRTYIAKAYHQKTGAYLFSAQYREYWRRGKHISTVVKYKKSNKKDFFSMKKINFAKNSIAPDMTYREIKTGYSYGSKKKNGGFSSVVFSGKPKIKETNCSD